MSEKLWYSGPDVDWWSSTTCSVCDAECRDFPIYLNRDRGYCLNVLICRPCYVKNHLIPKWGKTYTQNKSAYLIDKTLDI